MGCKEFGEEDLDLICTRHCPVNNVKCLAIRHPHDLKDAEATCYGYIDFMWGHFASKVIGFCAAVGEMYICLACMMFVVTCIPVAVLVT